MLRQWVRNEWALDEDGTWTQKGHNCMRNYPDSEANIRILMQAWDHHQWLETGDLIIGIPCAEDQPGHYFIVFYRREMS